MTFYFQNKNKKKVSQYYDVQYHRVTHHYLHLHIWEFIVNTISTATNNVMQWLSGHRT